MTMYIHVRDQTIKIGNIRDLTIKLENVRDQAIKLLQTSLILLRGDLIWGQVLFWGKLIFFKI